MTDIAIIGVGIVDSLGFNKDECWNNMLNGVVGISPNVLFNREQYPISKINSVHSVDLNKITLTEFTDKERQNMDRIFLLSMHSILDCIKDSNIASTDVSMIVGMTSSMKNLELESWNRLLNNKRTAPRQMYFAMRDTITSTITRMFGYTGATSTMSNMCTTSISSLDYAVRLLNDNDCMYSLVTGVDSFVHPLDMYVMQSMGATCVDEHPLTKPFDENRNGITLGEGSCSFMLTTLANAKNNNHKIYGIIKGIGHGTESVHETDMSTDGIGSRNAINMALRKANLSGADIGYVNCHATGTPQGDTVEYDIVSSMFPNVTVGANKSNIGHTMGACGMLELFYTIMALNRQVAPPIANLINPIGHSINIPMTMQTIDTMYALKNSFGFGGKSSCVVIERGTL
jgi:3-oxoacyl-[acyl-carrier-protein] synthase II